MLKREFVQLAHDYNPSQSVAGWFVSEKLEGHRGTWDGGVTRGLPIEEVPWANLAKSGHGKIATGLWSRYGHPIHAPNWFLDQIPKGPILDGELWAGRGNFQVVHDVIKHTTNLSEVEREWNKIKYIVFDAVSSQQLFTEGLIKNQHYEMMITKQHLIWYNKMRVQQGLLGCPQFMAAGYKSTLGFLAKLTLTDKFAVHQQIQLPYIDTVATDSLNKMIEATRKVKGCEGLILRGPDEFWFPKRLHTILKVKERDDDIATVVGYRTGREGKEGKLLGKMGSLYVVWRKVRFKLSGFEIPEREFDISMREWALSNPDEDCPDWFNMKQFPKGSEIKFTYRGLSDDGVPKEAAFLRD